MQTTARPIYFSTKAARESPCPIEFISEEAHLQAYFFKASVGSSPLSQKLLCRIPSFREKQGSKKMDANGQQTIFEVCMLALVHY